MPQVWSQLNDEMSHIVANVRRTLVQIRNGRGGAGAGTLWHSNGLIITNAHVVQRSALKVELADGRTLPAKVLAQDTDRDLAALAIGATGLPTIELGNSKLLQPGQWVLALGHPWGVTGAVSAGIVIDVGKPLEMPPARGEFIQVALSLRPGHSGGPLVDIHGRLMGVNTMITGPEVGLAVPIHVIKDFLQQKLGTSETGA